MKGNDASADGTGGIVFGLGAWRRRSVSQRC